MATIIDAHVHFGTGPSDNPPAQLGPMYDLHTGEQLIAVLDQAKIDRAVVFPAHAYGPVDYDPTYERANARVADVVARHPDRLIGFARVTPPYRDRAVREFRRCIADYKVKGLKLHPDWDHFRASDVELLGPLMELCAQHRLPVLIYSAYGLISQPVHTLTLAQAFPTVPIIVSHMGYRLAADAIAVAKLAPNVYLETSDVGSITIDGAIRALGADRVIYGSDLPYSVPEHELSKVTLLPGVSAEDKSKILGGNLSRLLAQAA